jgi:cell shape-determining protein MreC
LFLLDRIEQESLEKEKFIVGQTTQIKDLHKTYTSLTLLKNLLAKYAHLSHKVAHPA